VYAIVVIPLPEVNVTLISSVCNPRGLSIFDCVSMHVTNLRYIANYLCLVTKTDELVIVRLALSRRREDLRAT